MTIRSFCAAIVLASVCTHSAHAGDAYVGLDLIGVRSIVDFGGVNTAGGFSNNDTQGEYLPGVALKFGMRDQWQLAGASITPEIDLTWYDGYDISSASFPGAPAPDFFYNSTIDSVRLGANLWTPFHDDGLWRAEAGAGLGVMYRDVSTSDLLVQGSDSDYVAYGQLGFRFLRRMNDRGTLSLGTSYVFSDSTSFPLTFVGGAGGNFEIETNQVEISVGYQVKLGR